ncbi:MAG: trypsin-like serine protease [Rhabdochlamydiaceae bacterium]
MSEELQLTQNELNGPITYYLEKFKGQIPTELKKAYYQSVDAPYLSAIPIIREEGSFHKIFATGFIVNIAQKFFFVTAAHVMDDRTKFAIGLGDSLEGNSNLFNFERQIYHSNFDEAGGRDGDNDDFAISEIRNELALKILRKARTISKEDIQVETHESRWRAVVGYGGRQKIRPGELQPRCLMLSTREWPIEAAPTLQLSPERHALFSRSGRTFNPLTGTRIKNVKYEGMSGGPVWTLPTLSQAFSGDFKPKLLGMCVGSDSANRFINGTKISIIWDALTQIAFSN